MNRARILRCAAGLESSTYDTVRLRLKPLALLDCASLFMLPDHSKNTLTAPEIFWYRGDTKKRTGAVPALAIYCEKGVNCFKGRIHARVSLHREVQGDPCTGRGSTRALFLARHQKTYRRCRMTPQQTAVLMDIQFKIEAVHGRISKQVREMKSQALKDSWSVIADFFSELSRELQTVLAREEPKKQMIAPFGRTNFVRPKQGHTDKIIPFPQKKEA